MINEENEREPRIKEETIVDQEVVKISESEMRRTMTGMHGGKAVGPNDAPVEVWKFPGEVAVEFLTRTFNRIEGPDDTKPLQGEFNHIFVTSRMG